MTMQISPAALNTDLCLNAHAENKTSALVLVFNSGSSTLKFGLYRVGDQHDDSMHVLMTGEIENTGEYAGTCTLHDLGDCADRKKTARSMAFLHPNEVLVFIRDVLWDRFSITPAVIAHRIVHGGLHLREPHWINAEVMQQIEQAVNFAPLHTPTALKFIEASQQTFLQAKQLACFDTGFHVTLPPVSAQFAIPAHWFSSGLQRMGFHGLSCESIMWALAKEAPSLSKGKIIIAHLGHGASVTAVNNGKSVDTSMGLTPCGGVPMSSRSGDLDPGVLIYLLREKKMNLDSLEKMLNQESGLLGISGLSADMRELQAATKDHPNARLAIDIFCRALAKQVAGCMVVLGGADLLVFTGGIGENASALRKQVCVQLHWCGLQLDDEKNTSHLRLSASNPSAIISQEGSCTEIRIMHSQEDTQIARHASRLALEQH